MFEEAFGLIIYLLRKAALVSPVTSKRLSRRTEQSGESELIFEHNTEMDDKMDVE